MSSYGMTDEKDGTVKKNAGLLPVTFFLTTPSTSSG